MTPKSIVLIDPGHGGTDLGATSATPIEAFINLRVSQKLQQALRQTGFDPRLTRHKHDETVSLEERCIIERSLNPVATISIHCNGFRIAKANGFEVFTSPGQTESDELATTIFRAHKRRWPDRNFRTDPTDGDVDKEAKFRILTGTIGPAVLVELGFISNPTERDWLLHDHTQDQLAINLCEAISDWWQLQDG